MPWTQKQMLRDANGDLIPQYWDVVEQEFKPLTGSDGANDVRLTGSLTEYKEILLANSIAITDTNYHHYDGGNWDAQTAQQAKPIDDFNKYKYRRFLVINSLDQPLELELLHNLRDSRTYDNLGYGPDAEPQTVTLPNKGQYTPYVIDANIIPLLDGILGGNVTVRVRAKVAPTTGSFKLSIVMWN